MEGWKYWYLHNLLQQQLIPATGCTEPIALAYASSLGRSILGAFPDRIKAKISGSIVKNVKSVVVPGTAGMKGIETAISAGIVVGHEKRKLEVLTDIPEDTPSRIMEFMEHAEFSIQVANSGLLFDIDIFMEKGAHNCRVRIAGFHTNVVVLEKDGIVLQKGEIPEEMADSEEGPLKTTDVFAFATTCDINDVAPVIERQIECNAKLSEEGLAGNWGAEIGKILLSRSPEPDALLNAMAKAAAGSDARMSGCELPAVINSGSGNQGMTVTLPVLEYSKALGASREQLVRALVLANLVSIRIKQSIGCLSAYCGAVSAGCGAAAGIALLHGADESLVEHTVVNGLAILSGMICDGAKPSCAAKIAMSVEAGVLGFQMAARGHEFVHGEGIIKKGVDNTIQQIGILSREGLSHTNDVILGIMMN